MHFTQLRGARTHNLASVDLDLRPGQVVALTGVSGSGKSSLALDTLYAEGQRRFVESFSPYARQFLERLPRPPMTSLDPVPAGIAVDHRAPIKSSRSTLATMADIEPFIAALFLREAVARCPEHGEAALELNALGAARRAIERLAERRIIVTSRHWVQNADEYLSLRDSLSRDGYRRLWLDGETRDLDGVPPSALAASGRARVVIDRLQASERNVERLSAAIERAWQRGDDAAHVFVDDIGSASSSHPDRDPDLILRRGKSCPSCARPLSEPLRGLFSYESPVGACPQCRGFGRTLGIDWDKVIPDPRRSLSKGAVRPWAGKSTTWERSELRKLCRRNGIPMDVPFSSLSDAQKGTLIGGDAQFEGLNGWFSWLEGRTYKMHVRVLLSRYRSYDLCESCQGSRLGEHSLSFVVGPYNIAEWHALEVRQARAALTGVACHSDQGKLAQAELSSRLTYLERVGLGYLRLDRQARTLSGGEAQRVTLTAALGTNLHNALFVLDEPSVGLHASDVAALGTLIRELASRNNAVIVIEHDASLIAAADRVVELGPGAGSAGGRITLDASPAQAAASSGPTALALAPLRVESKKLPKSRGRLRVVGARANNLRGVDVDLPLGVLTVISGPSGSGKSTLGVDVVYRHLARRLGAVNVDVPGAHDALQGAELVRKVVLVDQSPLGRTSRGNAATYTKAWDGVRKLYAETPAAQTQGLGVSHFSFNVAVGRCPACNGEGFETVEMQFLADVRLSCPACGGARFKPEVLGIVRDGKSIADVLEMTVFEALERFEGVRSIGRALRPLVALGLGYLRLGQPLSTLSGGEAQRLKLARALGERNKDALFVLDEPSAGLHASEIERLLETCRLLVAAGGSVIAVEHDLAVIAAADWVVELGPGAGADGGYVVAEGSPVDLLQSGTKTGEALQRREDVATATHPTATVSPAVLEVRGAREHNLKQVSVSVPHQALTVVTGPSGSGKSSLAFDVIFAEGQRRFLETLTPYARQFLPTLPRPDVDGVTGVPPSVSLEQRTARAGHKSTVATVTEISHYLRLTYAKLGTLHCPEHDQPVQSSSLERLLESVRRRPGSLALCAPVVRQRRGLYLDLFAAAARDGIEHAIADGRWVKTDSPPRLAKTTRHTISLVLREAESLATLDEATLRRALSWGKGEVVLHARTGEEDALSIHGRCPECDWSESELDPRVFSFNTEQGRCPTCLGEGVTATGGTKRKTKRKRKATSKKKTRSEAADPATPDATRCPDCDGTRLSPLPRAVRLQDMRYDDLLRLSVAKAHEHVEKLEFDGRAAHIFSDLRIELCRRLAFLRDVGLGYLTLDRPASTLSGGEMQRLRLAAQLGAGLTGALYVLDEPTIGLHPRDTRRLLDNLRRLVDLGSTVLVVEHDEDTVREADHLIDLGPGGGSAGGRVMAAGEPDGVLACSDSPTGRVLSTPPDLRAPLTGKGAERLELLGAAEHNLRGVDVSLQLGRFNVVAGVSGSGKSTLVRRVLLPAVRRALGLSGDTPGAYRELRGTENLRRAISVDQSPIGRTPRSVPATFLGVWDHVRRLFAATPDAQVRGFGPTRFSFNSTSGGRCETCKGMGAITHEMSFLPDVVQDCPSCAGRRFEPRTLSVRYRGLSIGDVLDLPVEQAAVVFENHPKICSPLQTLSDLGAGYVTLGQSSHTLSGGEAQRLKLSDELTAGVRHEPTLYVLDEPTTGLHLSDVSRLMRVLSRLVDRGDTLVVIEHHPWVIAGADWVVELGPEGGAAGGKKIAEGSAARLSQRRTATGRVLRDLLHGSHAPKPTPRLERLPAQR